MDTKILDVIKRVLRLESVSTDVSQINCPQWDSMNHLMLVVELEAEFDCSFEPEEIAKIKSFGDIKEILMSK